MTDSGTLKQTRGMAGELVFTLKEPYTKVNGNRETDRDSGGLLMRKAFITKETGNEI